MRWESNSGQARGLPFQDTEWRRITQHFGIQNPIYRSGRHDGLDIAAVDASLGCPFPEGGQIIRAGEDGSSGGFGNFIALRGNAGGVILLAHMRYRTPWWRALLYRVPGSGRIAYGQFIGVTGNTGFSTGPHVHIQATLSSRFEDLFTAPVDPRAFLALRT